MAEDFVIEGVAELHKKFQALTDVKAQKSILRATVRTPMIDVRNRARTNLEKISPGKRLIHKTYLGRDVGRGFAQRSIRLIVQIYRDGTGAVATLGVRKEAYYVLQFFELGTSRIAKIPWLAPAFFESGDSTLRKVGETMKARIDRIAKARNPQ